MATTGRRRLFVRGALLVKAAQARLLLALLGLQSAACVALGYDFSDYGAASAGSGGSSELAPKHVGGTATSEQGGAGSDDGSAATTAEGGADTATSGQGGDGSILTTFCVGGGPHAQTPLPTGQAGQGGSGGSPECVPRDCFEAEAQCGTLENGCGKPLDCGPCFWWFEECALNRCIIP